jgi:hypothetical protein
MFPELPHQPREFIDFGVREPAPHESGPATFRVAGRLISGFRVARARQIALDDWGPHHVALRRSGDDDLSIAAADDLPVDENILAIAIGML